MTHRAPLTRPLARPHVLGKTLNVARGFALRTASLSDCDTLRAALQGRHPNYAGEYDYLGPYWPEMGAFVTAFVGYPQPAGGTLPRAKVVSIDVDN